MPASTDRRVLVDTDVVSVLFSGRATASIHAAINDSPLCISVVTLGEALKGARAAHWGPRRVASLLAYIDREFDVLRVDEAVAEEWASLVSQCMRRGFTPGSNDSWIAATAVVAEVSVLSLDAAFREISRLYPRLRLTL